MPNYTFQDTETDEVFDAEMKISELDEFLKSNPTYQQIFVRFPSVCDPVRLGVKKNSSAFQERTQKMRETYGEKHTNLGSKGNLIEV